jgi:hypothetical protein
MSRVVTAKQVHGTEILWVNRDTENSEGYDILMTRERGVAVAVKTADCLPILMIEPEIGVIAAIHAGWRGTQARVTEKAVREIVKLGGQASRILAALGPSHQGTCYEVGEDVVRAFRETFSEADEFLRPKSSSESSDRWWFDNAGLNHRELKRLGIPPTQIDRIDLCTHCREDLFHSYRRDGERAGRMVNFMQLTSGSK